MQALALDENGSPVYASQAVKGKNYSCLACKATVRRRGGDWVRDHFYHLQDSLSCHLAQKSETHLNLQLLLSELLPKGEALIEERFAAINRIADVAWPRYKLIFEIQVSPISVEELLGRIFDYKKMGWQVIWVLHTRSFFRHRAGKEELALASHPHYFANHTPQGVGDFFDVIWKGPYPPQITSGVELHHPLQKENNSFRTSWPLYFKGDFFDKALEGTFSLPNATPQRLSWRKSLTSAYHTLLESVFS